MVEVREAGMTGEYGWTERAGFSHIGPGKKAKEGDEACGNDCNDHASAPSDLAPADREPKRKKGKKKG
jgi:hypothetical protein